MSFSRAFLEERRVALYGFCAFCGHPCAGRVCAPHRDLSRIEHELLNPDPAATFATATAGSEQEGR